MTGAERQRKHRAKLKAGDPRKWPIRIFGLGTYYATPARFQYWMTCVMEKWPITNPERALLAYVAERIWRKGKCIVSIEEIADDIVPDATFADTCACWKKTAVTLRSLANRRLISLRAKSGDICKIEILNVPLRTLLETGRGGDA
jgi:hypothetical protein